MTRKLPSLNAIKAFEAVVRSGTTVAAAMELGVTHGAISRQLRHLEAWFGQPLFERESGRLVPTAVAGVYAAQVGRALDLIHDGAYDILNASEQIIRVSTTASFASEWLLHRLPGFHAAHPTIQIWIEEGKALTNPRSGSCDLAIRMGGGGWPDVRAEPLMDDCLFPVCTPALAAGMRDPRDLAGKVLLHDADPNSQWRSWFEHVHPNGSGWVPGPHFNSSSLLMKAAAAGQGVALARGRLVRSWLDAGSLVRPFAQSVRLPAAYWMITSNDVEPRRPLRQFLAWLRNEADTAW
jgi:LysR family transcriptional regulator, glycine cleavage system transcriptional activator